MTERGEGWDTAVGAIRAAEVAATKPARIKAVEAMREVGTGELLLMVTLNLTKPTRMEIGKIVARRQRAINALLEASEHQATRIVQGFNKRELATMVYLLEGNDDIDALDDMTEGDRRRSIARMSTARIAVLFLDSLQPDRVRQAEKTAAKRSTNPLAIAPQTEGPQMMAVTGSVEQPWKGLRNKHP